jgi:hypothetical protein
MTTTAPTTTTGVLVPVADPLFTSGERQGLAGFLAGYSGLTRDAYTLDLRQYTSWCATHGLHVFDAKRADIECFAFLATAAHRHLFAVAVLIAASTYFRSSPADHFDLLA